MQLARPILAIFVKIAADRNVLHSAGTPLWEPYNKLQDFILCSAFGNLVFSGLQVVIHFLFNHILVKIAGILNEPSLKKFPAYIFGMIPLADLKLYHAGICARRALAVRFLARLALSYSSGIAA